LPPAREKGRENEEGIDKVQVSEKLKTWAWFCWILAGGRRVGIE